MSPRPSPITFELITDPRLDGYRYMGLLGATIMSAKSIETAAYWVGEVLTHTWDIPGGSLWFQDRYREVYRPYQTLGRSGASMRAAMDQTFIADEHNPVLKAIATDTPFTTDLAHFQTHNSWVRQSVKDGMTHGLWGAIRFNDRHIGAIELLDRKKFHPTVTDQLAVGINLLEQYVASRKTLGRWRNMAIYSQALSDILTKAKPNTNPAQVLAQALYEYCGTIGALHYRLWMPDEDGRFSLEHEQGLLEDLVGVGTSVPDVTTQMAIKTGRMIVDHLDSEHEWFNEVDIYEQGVRSIVALLVTDHIGCPFAAITLFLPLHPDDRDNATLGIMESLADHLYLVVKAYVTNTP
ncbi:hypothetical protein [Stomatohabitans albus]|uniref:hypothetical protein n=1 Tax=Stomatohabitans albus TaxID=3110766 RepID=UPI00300C0083